MILAALLLGAIVVNPGNALAASCGGALNGDQAGSATVVQTAYQNWKNSYVTDKGAGGDLRVQRSSFDSYDTVSEGIAYGMLFSAYSNDKTTFDGLWAYAQKHTNSNGVMNWRIAADGSTTGYNGATDADEDIALALIAADTTWGGYHEAAIKQIDTIMHYQVEAGSFIIKPGDVWGGTSLLNPSYIAPSYYDVFQTYSGDANWGSVKTAGYRILQAAQSSSSGLFPDWSTSAGTAANSMSHDYGYDASRAPLRLAISTSWSCDQAAKNLLTPFNTWSSSHDLQSLASSYDLFGNALYSGDATPLLAASASAALASSDSTYRTTAWNALATASGSSYYPDSMRLFGLFITSGTLVNPLELPKRQPVVTTPTAPKTFAITSTDTAVTVNDSADLQFGVTAPDQRDDLLIDLELYDGDNHKVAQQVFEQQTLGTSPKTYTLRWKPSTAGIYTLKGGIFKAGWSQNLVWNDKAAIVSAKAMTASPTPSPVTTPSPTSTEPVVNPVQSAGANLSIWWPGSTQSVSGVQPFKAVVDGWNVTSYEMYWQVDGGQLNRMDTVQDSAPHKLSSVNLSGWKWSLTNRYQINFIAKTADGTILAQKATVITTAN